MLRWRGFCVILLTLPMVWPSRQTDRQRRDADAYADQPRLMTNDGHLVFQSGANHNITFRSSEGGSINVDGEDLKNITQTVKDNKQQLSLVQEDKAQFVSELGNVNTRVDRLSTTVAQLNARMEDAASRSELQGIRSLYNVLRLRVAALETVPSTTATPPTEAPNNSRQMRRLQRKVNQLDDRVQELRRLLSVDECLSDPCRNGGRCVDSYSGFICQCPDNWEGTVCENDVNECLQFTGTDRGCQNGATCINTVGGFRCDCAPNYYGIHCSSTHDDCSQGSSNELCGHGICVNIPRSSSEQAAHTCVCDSGWTTAVGDPSCTVDIDECALQEPKCFAHPAVRCINLPGSFTCGSCPHGYEGNGYHCADVDECLILNGGCSLDPRIDCINTVGSSRCGQCPIGYVGDGRSCHFVGLCHQGNGGCHPLALCNENTNIAAGRTCTCPSGYVGSGIGSNGCAPTTGSCANNPCGSHGTCQVSGNSYTCVCSPGFRGPVCELDIDECASNPCQHQGTCIDGANGFECECTASHTGTTCTEAVEECGGRFASNTGNFAYPLYDNQTYNHGVNCGWIISVDNGKIIMLNFSRFNIEHHSSCNYDFLQIHDGPTASSHIIGKYCGSNTPESGAFNSTHNQLFFWFHSDSSVSYQGFRVHWQAANPVCGGNLEADHGTIRSPGYPGNYPHNRDCVWTIRARPGKIISISLGQVEIERHSNCSYDYLKIYDGLLDSDPIIQRYCDSGVFRAIRTTGPYARLHFHSDRSLSDSGFDIYYQAEDQGDTGCSGVYRGSGTITSPDYPRSYAHAADCTYLLTVTAGYQVKLVFSSFNLGHRDRCTWNYVQVRNGMDETAPLVGVYCGSVPPQNIISPSNVLWVKFKSDGSNAFPGFSATFDKVCDHQFTMPGVTYHITSPGTSDMYLPNVDCSYTVHAPPGWVAYITFTKFDLQQSNGCGTDYMRMFDQKFCGHEIPFGNLIPRERDLVLEFHTDAAVQRSGFAADILIGPPTASSECGASFSEPNGTLSAGPELQGNLSCLWLIRANRGQIVELSIEEISINPEHADCETDYVTVHEAHADDLSAATLVARFCDMSIRSYNVRGVSMLVTYFSERSANYESFRASYSIQDVSNDDCSTQVQGNTGVITSPRYPMQYDHYQSCRTTIVVPIGNQIRLTVRVFDLESHGNCGYDYLEVRDGGYETSPLIGVYCGSSGPDGVISHSNRLFFEFHSDGSGSYDGYQIEFDGTTRGCGGTLTSPTGSIISPNHPQPYNHMAECYWEIIMSQGNRINIMILDFDMEFHSECNYDYIEIRDGGANGKTVGKYCGLDRALFNITTETNRAWLKFRSDRSNNGRGFQLAYSINCTNNFTDNHGVIESPNFPDEYQHELDCVWRVKATLGNTILGAFSHFNVEDHANCSYDYLKLNDGVDNSSAMIGRYCGQDLPQAVNTTQEWLYLHFHSDLSQAYGGFRFEYMIDGCGRDFNSLTGQFSSPGYPDSYPHSRECVWRITVPLGNAVALTIHDLSMEGAIDCVYDKLEVYGGLSQNAPVLTRICHEQRHSDQTLTTTGNTMLVRFTSDSSRAMDGFNATYAAVEGGCGGNFTTPSGNITSKNFPLHYPSNSTCQWTITVKPLHIVTLTFDTLDLENHATCNYDYVLVNDERVAADSTPLFVGCGTRTTPIIVRSSSNKMYIYMRSDLSRSGQGFSAHYTTDCGGTIQVDGDGAIISPNYPEVYLPSTNCSWTLQTTPGQRIYLQFTDIDVEKSASGHCLHDAVRVRSGDNADAPEIGVYCGQSLPGIIVSEGSALTILFSTDGSGQRRGFRATYSKFASSCGGELKAPRGMLTSPGYPDSYANDLECVWEFSFYPGSRLLFDFVNLDIEEGSGTNCNADYVQIRPSDLTQNQIHRFCGQHLPINGSVSMTQSTQVKFRSNEEMTRTGFLLNFVSYYGGEYVADSGVIYSPGYPQMYPPNLDVNYVITALSVDEIIVLTFEMLNLPESQGGSCLLDYIHVQETALSPLIATYCGSDLPPPLMTSSNQLRIVFHSAAYAASSGGFHFTWAAMAPTTPTDGSTTTTGPYTSRPPGCYHLYDVDVTTRFLTSPYYPSSYRPGTNCTWILTAVEGQRISFNILNINLESHSSCNYDYVAVYDGTSISHRRMGKFCNRLGNTSPLISTANVMTVYFKTDHSVQRTGFRAAYMSVCGGVLNGPTGVVQSPGFPEVYAANVNCTWVITVSNGKTVALHFEAFNIQESGGCYADYLWLQNGHSYVSPPLTVVGNELHTGKYCGTVAPNLVDTTSNVMRVTFFSDSIPPTNGKFKFRYEEKSVACGGQIMLTDDYSMSNFSSPNHPEMYPPNVDCSWVIVAPAHELIQLDFVGEFAIEEHTRCHFDYVEVHDGATENAPMLSRLCGAKSPSTIKTTTNAMYVRFRTDNSVTRTGFAAVVKLEECGGSYYGMTGSITSPNYPQNYDSNADCEWYIRAPTGHYLTLSFDAFDVGVRDRNSDIVCPNDKLQIREVNETGLVKMKACGSTLPSPVETADSFAYMHFTSGDQHPGSGFSMSWTASVEVCGGMLIGSTGLITSPNYPNLYAHARICTWLIKVNVQRRVTLTITDMDIEVNRDCRFDFIAAYNGVLDTSPLIGDRICGSTLPDPIQSSGSTMKVLFVTDNSVSSRGFAASYHSDEPSLCGGIISSRTPSGSLGSPVYNDSYSHNEQCIWEFRNLVTYMNQIGSIHLKFSSLQLEQHGECQFDFVEIREGFLGQFVGRYCGNTTLPEVTIPHGGAHVVFSSDASVAGRGFTLDYKFSECGGILQGSFGTINSPNYPLTYDHNDDCAWLIMAPDGYTITIQFNDNFNIEFHSKCAFDYLLIYNGGEATSPALLPMCGSGKPDNFTSQSNQVRVEFHSDGSSTASGFSLDWTVSSNGCGGHVHAQNGTILSPMYPSSYSSNTECEWEITVANGYHIEMDFNLTFELESNGTDCIDYVEVTLYLHNGTSYVSRYCGSVRPERIVSETNKIIVLFRSNQRNNFNGFQANFSAVCGAVYGGESGTIVSPGHPNNYENNMNCSYLIEADPQKFVIIEFEENSFRIEGQRRKPINVTNGPLAPSGGYSYADRLCPYDYLEVFAGANSRTSRLGRFCGNTAPQSQHNLGWMFIQFITDASITDRGWTINYRVSECGGVFTEPQGIIRTPTPDRYHHRANCTWLITVQEDRIVELKFNSFELEGGSSCDYDAVSVYEGNSTWFSSRLGRFCGTTLPEITRTTGNVMLVNFKSDSSVAKEGFVAAYRSTYGTNQGCGGNLQDANGTFESLIVASLNTYPAGLDCVWYIEAVDEMRNDVLELSFDSFVLESDDDCSFDYVEVRDGLHATDPVIGRYCGSSLPPLMVSSSGHMRVHFFTDSSVQAEGFRANYRVIPATCGGILYAGQDFVNMTSPGYPAPAPVSTRCRWSITAPYGKQVHVEWVYIDIGSTSDDCTSSSVQIRDYPTEETGHEAKYCHTDTLPPYFVSSGRTVHINLITSDAVPAANQSFVLRYQIQRCDRIYTSDNGRITSPGYPGNYAASFTCSFTIQVPANNSISIYFRAFHLEHNSVCRYDYLKVYNGSSTYAPLLANLCGSSTPASIFSGSNVLFFRFKTDSSVTYSGYDFTYTSSPNGCGGNLSHSIGAISSPPSSPTNPASCSWLIQAFRGKRIRFTFSRFNLNSDECVDLSTPGGDPLATRSFCGELSSPPVAFISTDHRLLVEFSSNSTSAGFKGNYVWENQGD